MFDLALYVSLHALLPLTGRRCVTPFPPASSLDPLPGEATAYADTLVCHEPTLTPYNFSLGPVGQAGDGSSTGGRRLDQDEVVAFDGAAEEGSDEPSGVAQRAKAEAAADIATWSDGIEAWDDWVEWGEGNGSHWDWQHAAKVSAHRDENHWNKRWRKSARSPPRRRLLYHEFEIERSPWDFWLQSKVEREARYVDSTPRRQETVDSTTTAPTRCHPHCCCTCLSAGSQIQRCSRMCQRCRRVRCRRVQVARNQRRHRQRQLFGRPGALHPAQLAKLDASA